MIDIDRLTSFVKFNICRIIPKPSGMDLRSIFQVPIFRRQLIVLMTHTFQKENFIRELKLWERIWLIAEVLPVNKDSSFLFCTYKINNESPFFFSNDDMLGGHLDWHREQSVRVLYIYWLQCPLLIDVGTGFNNSDSWRWYWALLTAFLSNWTIFSVNRQLQFLVTTSSEERISNLFKKSTC